MGVKESHNKKLLVEGKDDQHVIWALCEKCKIIETFDVIDCEGVENLFIQLPIRFKQSGVHTIGVIIDADCNIANRWNKLKDILTSIGFEMPKELPNEGLILINTEGKKIGVWIMPNNNTNGMLEDFISFLIPPEDKLFEIVNSTLEDIESKSLNKYSLIHKSKAKIHSWLSWQENPGTPMGSGITKKYLTTNQESCQILIGWISGLFAD